MDLLSILHTLWRYKLATMAVVLATVSGCYYAYAFVPPVYEATSSFVLVNPLPGPSERELEKDPALGRINRNNPYLRFGDANVLSNVLATKFSDDSTRDALQARGVDDRYEVAPGNQFGFSTPIINITARGDTPQAALSSAILLDTAVKEEIVLQQKVFGADDRYLVTPLQLTSPDRARERISARLRSVIAIAALGGFMLFVVISACVAVTARRETQAALRPDRAVADDTPLRPARRRSEQAPVGVEDDPHFVSR